MHGHPLPSKQGEVSRIGVRIMSNRSLALAMATLASMYIGSAEAQSIYVAPGGVYIAGGISPRILNFLIQSEFRKRFEAKGRFQSYLKAIPTYVITHPAAALIGLKSLVEAGG